MITKLASKINYVGKFNITTIIAAIFMIVGIAGIVLLPFHVNLFNLDVDFAGGTTMTYNMHKQLDKAELDAIEATVEEAIGIEISSIQKAGDGSEVVIKTSTLEAEQRDKVFNSLKEKYGLHDGSEEVAEGEEPTVSDIISVDNVDPVMGADLRNAAIISAVLAILLMLVYIVIRFDFRSAIAAVAALVHDVFVVMSAYIILGIPLNMSFIAVILTILGYSINATIVIFDRIRENKKLLKKTAFDGIVNTSVAQTVTRSVNTTITTLLAVVCVIIFGVSSIRQFAIPLAVGIVAGLFSSVFIAGPVWAKLVKSGKKA